MAQAIDRKLPEELLDFAVSFADRRSLINLCATSKTFNRIATRYLYSDICLRDYDDLNALVYLIWTSPMHANLVTAFAIPSFWVEQFEKEKPKDWNWPKSADSELPGVLRAKCAEFATSDEQASDWYERIACGRNDDAVWPLLLASLPNLRKLNMNFAYADLHIDIVEMLPIIANKLRKTTISPETSTGIPADSKGHNPDNRTGFSVPLDVMVSGLNDKYPNSTFPTATIIHLPNLRSLYVWKAGDSDGDQESELCHFEELTPRSCLVEYIELRCSKLHMQNLEHLLHATIPGKLKTFNYEVGCTWAWCKTQHPSIMTSLRVHKDTLEGLGLSHEDFYPYQFSDHMDSADDFPTPCSFEQFTSLKRLKVAPVYIWGHNGFTSSQNLKDTATKRMLWQALPNNLEELWITRAEHQERDDKDKDSKLFVPNCLIPSIQLVIQNKAEAEAFPKLRSFRIEFSLLKWKNRWFDDLSAVCDYATANGIKCTIILTEMFDHHTGPRVERLWGWDEDVEWEPSECNFNQECPKIWIEATDHENLGQLLKNLKARFKKELRIYEEAYKEINNLGPLCRDCRILPEYNAWNRVDFPQLAQWVELQAKMKSFSKILPRPLLE